MNNNTDNNDQELQPGNSLTGRIGTAVLAALTTIGFCLILYTGVRAAIYNDPASEEMLEPEVVLNGSDNEDASAPSAQEDDEDKDQNQDEDNDIDDNDDAEDEDQDDEDDATTDEDEDDEEDEEETGQYRDLPTSFTGHTNVGGAFLRAEAAADADIITQIPLEAEIEVLDSNYSEFWMYVSFDGRTGYIFADFIDYEE